ncbi:MAG: HEAT repeat domain-containing protein [Gemmatimonadota bacterium]|jgi:AraC family transcriptional regulator of adaptative response/methylated-DNA-[protein]-cysteine methyltransferase
MRRKLRQLLVERDFDEIARLAERGTRVLGDLLPLTYEPDPLIAWRAVEATGVAGVRIAERNPAAVREHLRRLYWLLSEESGGICWRAPEVMAELVGRMPGLYDDYVPIVLHLIVEMAEEDLGHFRVGSLWAIGRLGEVAAGQMSSVLPAVVAALDHSDPQVRGMAVWALARTGRLDRLEEHPHLLSDAGPVDFYEDGLLSRTSVGALVRRSLGGG